MFEIISDRLRIRPWTAEDRARLEAITSDREVMHHIHGGEPFSGEEVDGFLARQVQQLADFGFCMGALVETASGSIVGIAGTQPLGTTGQLEIGWILAREAWGRGYATEAGAAAMRYVLETLGRSRVVAIIDVENEPSKRVAARLGMQWEGRYTGEQLGHRKPEIVVDLYFRDADAAATR